MSTTLVPTIDPVTWTARTDRWLRAHPAGPDALLALVVAVTVGWYSFTILRLATADTWVLWVAGACSLALVGAVVARRAATGLAFVLAGVAMLVTVALPNVSVRPADLGLPDGSPSMEIPVFYLPTSAVFLVLLYSVAAHRPQRTSLAALGVGAAGALLCTAKTATAYGALPAGWLTLFLAVLALLAAVGGTWTMGVLQFERRRRRAEEASETAERAVTEERQRIARDMHDIVAHSLAVIVRQAEGGAAIVGRSPSRAADALSTIATTAREALTDMRGTLEVLRDGAPRETSQPSLADIPALVDRVRASGVDVRLVDDGSSGAGLTPGATMAIHRLVQEALTNSVKHSGTGQVVTVRIAHTPRSSAVTVTDDGGHDPRRSPVPGAGVGLSGVRDRVQAVGGTFEAGPLGNGFRVHAEFLADTQER